MSVNLNTQKPSFAEKVLSFFDASPKEARYRCIELNEGINCALRVVQYDAQDNKIIESYNLPRVKTKEDRQQRVAALTKHLLKQGKLEIFRIYTAEETKSGKAYEELDTCPNIGWQPDTNDYLDLTDRFREPIEPSWG